MSTTIDHELFLALNFDGGAFLDQLFRIASYNWTWIPLYIFILWLIYRRYGMKNMLIALLCIVMMVVVTDQIANFFKNNFSRLRPSRTPELSGLVHTVNGYLGGLYGTVSAHAATTLSIATFSAYLIHSRWFRVLIYLWTLLVCYSRIYLGVHFPLDILYGVITGVLISCVTIFLYIKVTGINPHYK